MRTFVLPSTLLFLIILIDLGCSPSNESDNDSLLITLSKLDSKVGNADYLKSPYLTAGDRLYMVGHQDGSFPDLGWHIQNEMGGIWDPPIKLMDGFAVNISTSTDSWCLDKAQSFVNYPLGNKHVFKSDNFTVERVQFVPDQTEGLVIEFTISNNSSQDIEIKLEFTGMIDLRPVWLAERLDIVDGNDEIRWDQTEEVFIANDPNNTWYLVFGTNSQTSNQTIGQSECSIVRKGNGVDASLSSELMVPASSSVTVQYYLAGSYKSKSEALKTYRTVSINSSQLLTEKIKRYDENFSAIASIDIPDKGIQDMYNWVRYNTDWLIREVPEIGRGLSAGMPDYPWWFGADNAYSLQGLLATGQTQEALSTINLILDLSEKENGNGRIIHEASTNGIVYNPGNLNETPHFIYLLWKTYEWTGDKSFLERIYPICIQGITWIEEQDKDHNGYPDGPGMMEIHGLHTEMIDVVVYLQQAFWAMSMMAEELGDFDNQQIYLSKASDLREKINSEWWVEESSSYADFRSTKGQALELIEAAMVRADTIEKPWTIEELKLLKNDVSKYSESGTRGYVVHHNWVVNTPMEMGVADSDKAELALKRAHDFSSKYGMYVTGIDRIEGIDESSKWEQFSYVGAVMTLPTGVQAISEATYGNPDGALEYLKMLHNSFSYALPGSLYEVSPDYGMITQAWTIYSVAVPIINHFFGIKPQAHKKQVIVRPNMPSSWERASLKNLPVGVNSISIKRNGNIWNIDQTSEGWTVIFEIPENNISSASLNGHPISLGNSIDGFVRISLTELENQLVIK